MNILVVAEQSSQWEDLHRAASALVKAFLRLGHKSWLVTGVYHDGAPAVDVGIVEKSESGYVEVGGGDPSGVPTIRVLSLKSLVPPGGVVFRNFSRVLNDLADRYDVDVVITVGSFWNGPEEAARWASVRRSLLEAGEALRRVSLVYVPFYMARGALSMPVGTVSRAMWTSLSLPTVLRHVDIVVVCCDSEAQEMRRFKPRGLLIESRCWLDVEMAEAIDRARPAAEGAVVYVGPLEEEKNVRGLARLGEALSKHGVRVVAVGRGAGVKLKGVEIVEAGGAGEVASYIKGALAGVDLSYYEPAGLRALEFLYAGVPVAVSPGSRAYWYISNGVDGVHLENPDDVRGAARWVVELLKRPELREEMGRRARSKAGGLSILNLAQLLVNKVGG
ncbi:MAG: glycosyltransferase [Pyrobaculum sp.]|jgi:glycosyltransferase involved in cell wall biosynthesis